MSKRETSQSREEAAYLLQKITIECGGELLGSHQWAWEVARWKELVFALLTRIAGVPEKEMRRLTNQMGTLGLLNIQTLANLANGRTSVEARSESRMLELFQEYGFSEEQAKQGLTVICEAAIVLQERYDGKIQKYLRHYGELILKDVDRIFKFSALGQAEVASAFTYWLQNVLGMPLSLVDVNVQIFCREHNLQPEDLIAAADDMGLNLGFVDDLVYLHNTRLADVSRNREERNR